MTEGRRCVLIVEDHPLLGKSLERAVRALAVPRIAGTVAEALRLLGTELDWAAAIIDVRLPDGRGFDVVKQARARLPVLPILVLTGLDDVATINEAHGLRVSFACKPFQREDVLRFVREALSLGTITEPRIQTLVGRLVDECKLTPREAQIVHLALAQKSRGDLGQELGISANTLKTQVKGVLRKTGHESIAALSRSLLRDLLESK